MSEIVHNCPRCRAEAVTFDAYAQNYLGNTHGWVHRHEIFAVCRRCKKSTTLNIELRNYDDRNSAGPGKALDHPQLNRYFRVVGHVSIATMHSEEAPKFTPDKISKVFLEAEMCRATSCWNAAAAMYRLCIDLATKALLSPEKAEDGGPNRDERKKLGPRVLHLIETGKIANRLKGLADCIREDGNDGVHDGTLTQDDADDLAVFTKILLEDIYLLPGQIRVASERREARRLAQQKPE